MANDKYALMRERLGREPLDLLQTWEAAKVPAEAMARLLQLETGVPVCGATILRWLRSAPVAS